jgi:hypothetical protein
MIGFIAPRAKVIVLVLKLSTSVDIVLRTGLAGVSLPVAVPARWLPASVDSHDRLAVGCCPLSIEEADNPVKSYTLSIESDEPSCTLSIEEVE